MKYDWLIEECMNWLQFFDQLNYQRLSFILSTLQFFISKVQRNIKDSLTKSIWKLIFHEDSEIATRAFKLIKPYITCEEMNDLREQCKLTGQKHLIEMIVNDTFINEKEETSFNSGRLNIKTLLRHFSENFCQKI
jgi:hypothetical protein